MFSELRVLVLEDHAVQRTFARTMLSSLGVGEVIEAVDGADALCKLRQIGGVDVALCDLRMPHMDGVALLSQAARANLTRSIILSSDVDQSLRNAVANLIGRLGMAFLGDLGKPYTRARLEELLARHCRPAEPPAVEVKPPRIEDHEVHSALSKREFAAYFQPKYDMREARFCGAEVLVRWRHPEFGLLAPGAFLGQVEALGLLDDMFLQLFAQGLAVQKQMPGTTLAYNLEVSQLTSLRLPKWVGDALQSHGVPASGVTFEITETGAMRAPSKSLETMIRLRLMGCGLSMDDFGAGFASLSRLCEMPFDQVKLDRSFMRSFDPGSRSYAAIACAVALAKSLDISLVIEGVESHHQQQHLLALGCTQAQGFLFAQPMPAEEFLNL